MRFIYTIGIFLYSAVIKIVSLFNEKAKLRLRGTKETFTKLKKFKPKKLIWIHCASLGEFEQGRPLIEKIKTEKTGYQIALSFFSPSGYEVRKDYEFADIVFYLPDDTSGNAEKLISLLKPKYAFFVKYEFWHNYIKHLKFKNIPVYSVSGIFRKNQIFFKPYGNFFRDTLNFFTHLFVQNSESEKLLKNIGINKTTVVGDTRFDRVFETSLHKKKFEKAEKFINGMFVIIAGSTWKPDEDIILKFAEEFSVKVIIAPHLINTENINRIIKSTKKKAVRYSDSNTDKFSEANILIIDNIGMLSSLYFYADVAYVGGGFGSGIHNTLEAAVFGIPVIFGPKYEKFEEAKELINRNAGFSISQYSEFKSLINRFVSDEEFRKQTGANAGRFVKENLGATEKILSSIKI